jgi:hypothetical protein
VGIRHDEAMADALGQASSPSEWLEALEHQVREAATQPRQPRQLQCRGGVAGGAGPTTTLPFEEA